MVTQLHRTQVPGPEIRPVVQLGNSGASADAAGKSGGLRPAALADQALERRFAEFNLVQVNSMIKNEP